MQSPILRSEPWYLGLTSWATVASLLLAAVFLTNWPSYHYLAHGGPLPLFYYALPAIVAFPMFFARPDTLLQLLRAPLSWWFIIYVASGAIWLLLSQDFIEDASKQWRLRALALLLFLTIAVVASESKRAWLALAVLGAVVVASAFNWWDVMRPNVFLPPGVEGGAAGRGAGFFINSNAAAAFITAGSIAALPFVPMAMRAAVLLSLLVGISPTFSRSGFLCAALVVMLAIAFKFLNRVQVLLLVAVIPVIVTATTVYYDAILSSSDLSASEDVNLDRVVQRLTWFQDMQGDESIEDRIYPAIRAWEMFLDAPITGKGVGVTSRPILGDGTHNMYLMLMAEQGFTGLALYLSLIGIIAVRGWRLSCEAVTLQGAEIGKAMVLYAVFLALYGFFSHNVLEEPHGIFLMAFLSATGLRVATRDDNNALATSCGIGSQSLIRP